MLAYGEKFDKILLFMRNETCVLLIIEFEKGFLFYNVHVLLDLNLNKEQKKVFNQQFFLLLLQIESSIIKMRTKNQNWVHCRSLLFHYFIKQTPNEIISRVQI